MASSSPGADGSAVPTVTLRHLGEYKDGKITMYTLELESCGEHFMVAKRYRELLGFHTRLLEKIGEHALPAFPPKEPLMQKMFSRGEARVGFAEERKAQLEKYLKQLLQRRGALLTPAVHDFLRASAVPGESWSEVAAVLISGVRVLPGSAPGSVAVVVRVQTAASCQVRLALRPLDGHEPAPPREPPLNYGEGSVWRRCEHLDVPAGGGEVSQDLSLEPGTEWQVGTICVVGGEVTGNAAYVKLLAPTQGADGPAGPPEFSPEEEPFPSDAESMPTSSWEEPPPADAESMPTGTFVLPTGTFVMPDEQSMPPGTSALPEAQGVPRGTLAADVLDMPTGTFVAASVIDLTDEAASGPAAHLAGAGGGPEDEAEELGVRQISCTTFTVTTPSGTPEGPDAIPPMPVTTYTIGDGAEGSCAAPAPREAFAGDGRTDGVVGDPDGVPMPGATFTFPDAVEGEDEAEAAPGAPSEEDGAGSEPAVAGGEAESDGAAPRPPASEEEEDDARSEEADPEPSGAAPGRRLSSGAAWPPARKPKEGREMHKVIGFQGVAAARYMKQVEESQKASIERVPHRFEAASDGKKTSVNLKFSVVHNEAPAAPGRPGAAAAPAAAAAAADAQQPAAPLGAGGFAPAEVLDQSRRQQQLEQSREDEQAVARWVHAVTGDAGALEAAEGRQPLEEALQSGEALCDLVNAIWPGQITGTVRGEAQGGRRLLNITRFVQACPQLGVRTEDMFAPPDLAERKNLRSVVRCLFALAAVAVGSPELQGRGLQEARALAASKPG